MKSNLISSETIVANMKSSKIQVTPNLHKLGQDIMHSKDQLMYINEEGQSFPKE